MHKNTRLLAVSMLLIGFLLSNPIIGICAPMLSDIMTDSHSEMTSGCCDSENDMAQQSHNAGLTAESQGCDCCGCGLQTDDSTLPSEQPAHAVMLTSVYETITSWKTVSTQTVADLLPDTAKWDDYPPRQSTNASESVTNAHSPPLFILHQVLLN